MQDKQPQTTTKDLRRAIRDFKMWVPRVMDVDFRAWNALFKNFIDFVNRTPIIKAQFDQLLKIDCAPSELFSGDSYSPPAEIERRLACIYRHLLSQTDGEKIALDFITYGENLTEMFEFFKSSVLDELLETLQIRLCDKLEDLSETLDEKVSIPMQAVYVIGSSHVALATGGGNATVKSMAVEVSLVRSVLESQIEKMLADLESVKEALTSQRVESEGAYLVLKKELESIKAMIGQGKPSDALTILQKLKSQSTFNEVFHKIGQVTDGVTLGLVLLKILTGQSPM